MKIHSIARYLLSYLVFVVRISALLGEEEHDGECSIDAETGTCRMDSDPIAKEEDDRNRTILRDLHDNCLSWAELGECDVNPK